MRLPWPANYLWKRGTRQNNDSSIYSDRGSVHIQHHLGQTTPKCSSSCNIISSSMHQIPALRREDWSSQRRPNNHSKMLCRTWMGRNNAKKGNTSLSQQFLGSGSNAIWPGGKDKHLRPVNYLKEVKIGLAEHQKTKFCVRLAPGIENIFTWSPHYDMSGIDPKFICYRLSLNPFFKPVAQKKRKQRVEKMTANTKETNKQLKVEFI